MSKTILYIVLAIATVIAPFVFPSYSTQLATLWLMIIVALTWDLTFYGSSDSREQADGGPNSDVGVTNSLGYSF